MNNLKAKDLTKSFHHNKVVDNIGIHIKTGEIVGLLGRNGAGKTTTFLMLSGILKPDSGDVFLDDVNINPLPSYKRAEKGMIYMPQQHSVFVKTSVFNNLFMILELNMSEHAAKNRAMELINEFGLDYVKDSLAYQLSGGEKRRLEIARAMIKEPKFLFLDEPFTGIDPITVIEISKIIYKLKVRGIGIIITDHNVRDTFDIIDRAYIIHKGRILSAGPPAKIVKDEKIKELFLGEDFQWQEGIQNGDP